MILNAWVISSTVSYKEIPHGGNQANVLRRNSTETTAFGS